MRESAAEPLIRTVDLSKCYHIGEMDIFALYDVDFVVEAGDFVAVMGPSGSGKSTLMHILGCLDKPTGGEYFLSGEPVSSMDDIELARIRALRIGFVFQSFNLLPRTSALENVLLPMLYSGSPVDDRKAVAALQRVGLGNRLYHKPNELSGGQQQRVAIARALVNGPDIILADEPTGNLATEQSEEIMHIFQELNNEGITVIIVTHEQDIGEHARRIIRFKDGRIIVDMPVADRIMAADVLAKERSQGGEGRL